MIFWIECDKKDLEEPEQSGPSHESAILKHVPESGTIEKKLLGQTVNEREGVAINPAEDCIEEMLKVGRLFTWKFPRSTGPAAVHVSRQPQPKAS